MKKLENTIMMVEDDISIFKLFSYILKKAGFEVIQFPNGKDACNWAKENVPTLVLCDIMLKDMNGVEIVEFLRGLPEYKELPVIAVTALARKGDREKYLECGFTAYYSKPINTKTFATEIKDYIK